MPDNDFPKRLFVTVHNDDGDPYTVSHSSLEDIDSTPSLIPTEVGVYELKEIGELVTNFSLINTR